jgi:hypothetical protein
MDIFNQPEVLERYLLDRSTSEDSLLTELSRHTFVSGK